MKPTINKRIVAKIDQHLADSRLSPRELIRKRWAWIWMVMAFLGVFSMTLLALILGIRVEYGFSLLLCYLIAFPFFRRLKRFDLVINILFTFCILLTFIYLLHLGGLSTSSGLVLVGLNCAMGSALVGNLRWTYFLFLLYGLTIVLTGFLEPYLTTPEYLTPRINTIFFVLNTLWISAIALFLMVLFMKEQSRFEKAEAEQLRRMDEAKTLLYTNVSHEFRTPLTVIQGVAEQIEKSPKHWLKSGPQKIKAQCRSLLQLVNQMLDISKIEAESMPLNLIHGDINQFIHYITSSFAGLAEHSDVSLEFISNADPIYTDYDPEKIMQVLSNLLSNAIKYTPAGGSIHVECLKKIENGKELVSISVRDSGKGIPQDAIEHIFDRFYQVPDRTIGTPGTGLGLALTCELVKLMNGDINVKSEINKGSEFVITIPLTKNPGVDVMDGTSLVEPDDTHLPLTVPDFFTDFDNNRTEESNKPILLIVEDNDQVIEYLVSILEKDYLIELARNGNEGFEKAKNIIPDMILTDIMMPEMDGLELLESVKNEIRTDHIPVIVLTARGDFQSKIAGLEIGADHYIVKPFYERELSLKLKNLLESRKRMQEKLGTLPFETISGHKQYRQEIEFLSKINDLLNNHLEDETFGVSRVAKSLNISRPQLYRKFTALTDLSLGQYIKRYRLHSAKNLIVQEGKNVTEAAMDSGFKNLSHFSTSFKEEFGYPPSKLL